MQDRGDLFFTCCVQTLRRLVEQQNIWLAQKHLCQRQPLLFAAGNVIGVALQQRRQAAPRGQLARQLRIPGLQQFLAHRLFREQRLRVLWEERRAPRPRDLPALGL